MELLSARGLLILEQGSPLLTADSLVLRSRMRVALTGPSESGQAQLLAVLAGEQDPDEGKVLRATGVHVHHDLLADPRSDVTVREVAAAPLAWLQRLGLELRQLEHQLDSESALERYYALAEEYARAGGYSAETDLERTLASFNIPTKRMDDRFSILSSGEKRRVRLAGALVSGADVLLLHEPDSGLDTAGQEQLAGRLRRWPGAVLFTSHDRSFMSSVSTHVGVIESGALKLTRGRWPAPKFRQGSAETPRQSRQLLSWTRLTVRAEGYPLFTAPALSVHGGERIALVGSNGAGKSTLLKLLADDAYYGSGDTGISWEDRVSVEANGSNDRPGSDTPLLEGLRRLTSDARARQLLGLLRVARTSWSVGWSALSPDVRARANVIRAVASEADLLLLDEPTDRLDLPAIELLEEAILGRSGATIFVTHDVALAHAVATRVWEIREGELHDYRGGFEGWRAGRLRREASALEHASVPAGSTDQAKGQVEPDELEQTENELAAVEEELDDPVGVPGTRLARLRARRVQLIDRASELINTRQPAPRPRFRIREGSLVVEADVLEGAVSLLLPVGASAGVRLSETVAHISVGATDGAVLLPWAKRSLVNALTRLSFYALGARVVQYWDGESPVGLLLRPAGSDWHVLNIEQFEELEGWTGRAQRRVRRRRRRHRK